MYTGNSYPNTWHGVSPWGVAVLIIATGQDQLVEAGLIRQGRDLESPARGGREEVWESGASESLGRKFTAEGQVGRKE